MKSDPGRPHEGLRLCASSRERLTFHKLPRHVSFERTHVNVPARGRHHFAHATVPLTWITTVPEPGTYALLLAGLGLIGMATRRRSQRIN